MIVFPREIYLCKCATISADSAEKHSRQKDPPWSEVTGAMRFMKGTDADLERLDRLDHEDDHLTDFRARLAAGEHWLVGLLGERIATYTWLHMRRSCDYPYWPRCVFNLASGTAYGYDAWTHPDLRGDGLRRRAFLEELGVLHDYGMAWEASFFVDHQLEGARRSLARVGIEIVPLYRVELLPDRRLSLENMKPGDTSASPAFNPA